MSVTSVHVVSENEIIVKFQSNSNPTPNFNLSSFITNPDAIYSVEVVKYYMPINTIKNLPTSSVDLAICPANVWSTKSVIVNAPFVKQ